jgi:hypothetical protein
MLVGMTNPPSNRAAALVGNILLPGDNARQPRHRSSHVARLQSRLDAFCGLVGGNGFIPVPAAPATVGAYLASLAESHAPSTIRRRLSAIGKMHRFNDLPWNPGHRDIQGPLQGLLRSHGRPARQAAALSLAMLRQLPATCDQSKRGRRDRALLLFGFAGALRAPN